MDPDQVNPADLMRKPTITAAASLSSTKVKLTWEPPTPSTISGYQPIFSWEDGSILLDQLSPSADNATLTAPSVVPNGSWIQIAGVNGQAIGPFSDSVPFVVEVVSGLEVSYDGTTLNATWTSAKDARVNAYEVTFTVQGQKPVTELVYTNSWSQKLDSAGAETASLSVRLVAGFSLGPAAAAVDAIIGKPEITGAAFNGAQLNLKWSAVSDAAATAYVIAVVSGGQVMSEYTSGGTSAAIPFAAGLDTIQVRAIGPNSTGPFSEAFTPITSAPDITSIAFGTDGSLKVDWEAIEGAGNYKLQLRLGNSTKLTKTTTTNSLTIPASELPPSDIYDLTVQAFANDKNDDVSGPASGPLPAVALSPPDVVVAYDGRNARVKWQPIVSSAISGYVTTILDGQTAVKTANSLGPAVSIEVDYAAQNNYTVVVQALTNNGAGQPSPPAALFQSGWYASSATNASSHLIPANGPAMSPHDIVVHLPNIFTSYVSTGLPTAPPFVFATTDPPYSYTLTIPASSGVWTFNADSIRGDILEAYQALLTQLVQLKVTPLGWRMVQDAISRSMPQTFAESLFYAFAFVPGDGYVDLKPGMLLRADFESYQYLGSDQTNKFVNGFVSSSSAFYEIGSYVTPNNQWLTGFDSFLSLVTQSGSTVPPPQSQGSTASGGGGIVDLYYSQFRKPYMRLVYPPDLPNDSKTEVRAAFNVAVLAANDYPTLEAATQNLRNAQTLPTEVAVTYLRGRTIISACIRIWVDNQPLIVPVGTSVGNILEGMGRRPPIVVPQNGNPGIPLSGLTLERSIGYAVSNPNGYSSARGVPIRLDWNKGMAYSATSDWLNVPLLPGDRITTRGNE